MVYDVNTGPGLVLLFARAQNFVSIVERLNVIKSIADGHCQDYVEIHGAGE